jgi:hypothetical protein
MTAHENKEARRPFLHSRLLELLACWKPPNHSIFAAVEPAVFRPVKNP